jgi:hypothetical protein
MIEVNGYLVSIRLVANDATSAKELSGSSSHVSISSPFSSH